MWRVLSSRAAYPRAGCALLGALVLCACEVESRTATLRAQVDVDDANKQWIIHNLQDRDWDDVTFTASSFYHAHRPKVAAQSTVRIPFSEFVDDKGEIYDPSLGLKTRMWISTPKEYWGLQ